MQIIKFTIPVVTDSKNINIVLLNILYLLPVMVLNDHLVHAGKAADISYPLFNRINHAVFAAMIGILLRSHPDDQVISQCLGSLQKSLMPFMKQIKHAVRNDFLHFPNNSLRYKR